MRVTKESEKSNKNHKKKSTHNNKLARALAGGKGRRSKK